MTERFAFIGTGNMASAIIGGLQRSGILPEQIVLYDKNTAQYEKFAGNFRIVENVRAAVELAEVIVLAVKPQNYEEVLEEIRGVSLDKKVLISIAAGISTAYIESRLGPCAVVRTMPNTPLLIGKGVTALCRNSLVSDEDFDFVDGIFAASGTTLRLPESEMNKIIAATSSAPAYVFLLIKAICDGAASQGIVCDDLRAAVCNMMIGSASLALESPLSLDELIRMVTSPKGTTEQAMNVFYQADFEEIVQDAMDACTRRADELAKK